MRVVVFGGLSVFFSLDFSLGWKGLGGEFFGNCGV